jgi:hypothetical protein
VHSRHLYELFELLTVVEAGLRCVRVVSTRAARLDHMRRSSAFACGTSALLLEVHIYIQTIHYTVQLIEEHAVCHCTFAYRDIQHIVLIAF